MTIPIEGSDSELERSDSDLDEEGSSEFTGGTSPDGYTETDDEGSSESTCDMDLKIHASIPHELRCDGDPDCRASKYGLSNYSFEMLLAMCAPPILFNLMYPMCTCNKPFMCLSFILDISLSLVIHPSFSISLARSPSLVLCIFLAGTRSTKLQGRSVREICCSASMCSQAQPRYFMLSPSRCSRARSTMSCSILKRKTLIQMPVLSFCWSGCAGWHQVVASRIGALSARHGSGCPEIPLGGASTPCWATSNSRRCELMKISLFIVSPPGVPSSAFLGFPSSKSFSFKILKRDNY